MILQRMTAALLLVLVLQQSVDAVDIWGRVVDENNDPLEGATQITVLKRDGTKIERTTKPDGSYRITVAPADVPLGDVIDSVRFKRADRHPGLITSVAGRLPESPPKLESGAAAREDYVNKVLFPRVGPEGYARNIAQLAVYEYLYYLEMTEGKTRSDMQREYGFLLTGMPRSDDMMRLPKLTSTQRSMLRQKRAQVFRLFGMELPEGEYVQKAPQPYYVQYQPRYVQHHSCYQSPRPYCNGGGRWRAIRCR